MSSGIPAPNEVQNKEMTEGLLNRFNPKYVELELAKQLVVAERLHEPCGPNALFGQSRRGEVSSSRLVNTLNGSVRFRHQVKILGLPGESEMVGPQTALLTCER
jgi:hypothetical protein